MTFTKPNPPDLAWYLLESGISQIKKIHYTGLIPSNLYVTICNAASWELEKHLQNPRCLETRLSTHGDIQVQIVYSQARLNDSGLSRISGTIESCKQRTKIERKGLHNA